MKTLAVVAHDNRKADFGFVVGELLSGPDGGDAQAAALVAVGWVNAVLFFIDPLSAQPHEPDIRALMRVCNVHNVPLATNVATADLIIAGLTTREREGVPPG